MQAAREAPKLPALTKAQKAAAILVALGKPAAGRLLKFFKQDELRFLMEGARGLRAIPQVELERIVAEFESEFAEGVGLLDSADTMDSIFSETLSAEEMNALMGGEVDDLDADMDEPVWPLLEKIEAERLGEFLAAEHPQTAAFALTKVPPSAAARVLLTLAKPVRGEIVKRMLDVGEAAPAAVHLLEMQLRAALIDDKSGASSSSGQARVASVLNELDKSDLDSVMDDLASAGATNIEAIRSQLFAFEDIEMLDQHHRVALFDGIQADVVTMALRGDVSPALVEAILSALGARARRMIEAELKSDAGNLAAADIVKARRQIASTAIKLASESAIKLPQPPVAA
jgi:flagellar motor switch protein FliG